MPYLYRLSVGAPALKETHGLNIEAQVLKVGAHVLKVSMR